MSQILWREALTPAIGAEAVTLKPDFYGEQGIRIPNALPLPVASKEIPLPDPKAFRSMSRAAILMTQVCMRAQPHLEPFIQADPFSVGLYSAVDPGPMDYPSTHALGFVKPEEFFDQYKKLRSPKVYLKQLPNLAAAQIGIFLKIQGPMGVFNHTVAGGLQALEQAERDLRDGVIRMALVCTGFSFEDSLQTMRARQQAPESVTLCEGAAALLLGPDGAFVDWKNEDSSANQRYYGIAQPIIQLALAGGDKDHGH